MDQLQKIIHLLLRNEDWILAKIFAAAKKYNQSECISLINFSWRQTIKSISEILVDSENKCSLKAFEFASKNNNTIFQQFSHKEVENCNDRNIEPHVYLSFLKLIRSFFEDLISEANLYSSDKIAFYKNLEKCFNCIEVDYIRKWSEFSKKTPTNIIQKDKNITYFSSVINLIPIPVLFINTFHKIISFNTATKNILPYLFEKHKPDFDNTFQISEKDELNSKIDQFRISKDNECRFNTTITTYTENFFTLIILNKIQLTDNIMVSIIDLSQWKNLENKLENSIKKAEKSDRLKTMFLANMSHEIRTPMNAIVGFSELLSMTKPNQKDRKEYFNLIKKSSNDLLNIIEDVIDIAKIESQQLKICKKATKPAEIIFDLSKLFREVLTRQGNTDIKLYVSIPENERNLTFRTDPKRLKQVLSNLLGNASKFTESGSIEIGYKIAENKLIYFFVKDTGIGIPYEIQPKVFEQFVQVQKEYTKNNNGTGLGLAISKNIVNLLGGKIWLSSVPDKGSTFYFYLPNIKVTTSDTQAPYTMSISLENISLVSKTLLVAEDEDSNYKYLYESLRETGINFIRAKTGSEAISITEKNDKIDIILMDIKMPEINGIDAAKYIKHIKPHIPIIAQTALVMESDRKACLDAGCIEFISKPLQIKELLYLLKKHCRVTSASLI